MKDFPRRAGNINPESEEYSEPIYDDEPPIYYRDHKFGPPLRPIIGEKIEFVKDANGWIHLIKDNQEQGHSSHSETQTSTVSSEVTMDTIIAKYEERLHQ